MARRRAAERRERPKGRARPANAPSASTIGWGWTLVALSLVAVLLAYLSGASDSRWDRGTIDTNGDRGGPFNHVPQDINSATRFLLSHDEAKHVMHRLNNSSKSMWDKIDGHKKQCSGRQIRTAAGICFLEAQMGYHARYLSTLLTVLHAWEALYSQPVIEGWSKPLVVHMHEWVRAALSCHVASFHKLQRFL